MPPGKIVVWCIYLDREGRVVEMNTDQYILELQRSLLSLIQLAQTHGLNGDHDVNQAKEFIRCIVLGCGFGGACNGEGGGRCPLKRRT